VALEKILVRLFWIFIALRLKFSITALDDDTFEKKKPPNSRESGTKIKIEKFEEK
jgi:hypothetical protein